MTPSVAPPVGVRVPHFDVATRPFLVLLELTRACDLACRHCRAEALPTRHPDELTAAEVRAIFEDLAALGAPRPIVVLTGGDPFKRPDLAALVRSGAQLGLSMAVSPSGTPLSTRDRLAQLRDAGAGVVSFSIDGASPVNHEGFRGVDGSYAWTLQACHDARAVGLRLQINTTVTATTVEDLPEICRLVRDLDANLWSVFFLVTTGRGRLLSALNPSETEDVLHFLNAASFVVPLKTTEAPQYRRVVAEHAAGASTTERGDLYRALIDRLSGLFPSAFAPEGSQSHAAPSVRRRPLAVGDGRGVVFVSHTGEVSPSGFLPVVAGNVRDARLIDIYRHTTLFRDLRDPDRLSGRCRRCEYRAVCGGSRARAYAAHGDPLAEDPACPYVPGSFAHA